MPSFVVTRVNGGNVVAAASPSGHPKMVIVAEGRSSFVVPFAPNDVTTEGIAAMFLTVERGGMKPLLIRGGDPLKVITFDLIVAEADPGQAVTGPLTKLRNLAESGARMKVKLDKSTSELLWRLTSFSENVIARQFGTNEPTRAVCSLTFTEVSDPVKAAGPASGGAAAGGGGGKGGKGSKKTPKSYTVKKGDTLHSISKDIYGVSRYWHLIADENKIKDPKKLKVGQKLKLPRVESMSLTDDGGRHGAVQTNNHGVVQTNG